MVYTVKDAADLESQLEAAGEKLVVIDFFAVWCGPCKVIAPKLAELQTQYSDIIVLKVDVDECEDLAMKYDVSSMPTFLFLKNKQVVDSFSGANAEKLESFIKKHSQ